MRLIVDNGNQMDEATHMTETATTEKIGNNYGVALSPQEFVERQIGNLKPTDNNLTMRQQMCGLGFSRVSRQFANEVMELVKLVK